MSLCEYPAQGCEHTVLLPYRFPSAEEETGPEKDSDSPRVTQLGSRNLHVWVFEPRQGPGIYIKSLILVLQVQEKHPEACKTCALPWV